MSLNPRTPTRRGLKERGAVLVEAAIVLPLLLLLLFGMIEFGVALNDYQSIRQGARDSARSAVVAEYSSAPSSCGINGSAATAPANARAIICLTKQATDIGNDLRVGVRVNSQAPTFEDGTIKVCSVRNVRSITGFIAPFIDGIPLRTKVTMRVEQDPEVQTGNYLETDPTGQSWSWC